MQADKKGVIIAWVEYQRRVEVLAPFLELETFYFSYAWETRSKLHKMLSYFLKSFRTLICLFQNRPALVLVQFPPAPALYCVALYSWLMGARYVSDCHMGITNENWFNWMYVKKLLARGQVIVHNVHLVDQVIHEIKVNPFVLRDGVAKKQAINLENATLLETHGLIPQKYVLFPCSFSLDEPLQETLEAARLLSDIRFVLTWYSEKLPKQMRDTLPANVLLTGFLEVDDFNCLFANAGIALVLTKHEAVQLSAMQEAMAFEVPAVVSDLKTTRFLYKEYPVYVKNDSKSIAEGILHTFQDRANLEERMRRLRIESEKEFSDQIANLKSLLEYQK
ncbi:MAG: glycosyltransferase family 4 protein [Clostridiales bacterium]|nr:glycosyltransferase family 4 protein [Clostridiales bacterium]